MYKPNTHNLKKYKAKSILFPPWVYCERGTGSLSRIAPLLLFSRNIYTCIINTLTEGILKLKVS